MKTPQESKVREKIVIVTMILDTYALVKYLFWDFMLGKANITVLFALVTIWFICVIVMFTDSYE